MKKRIISGVVMGALVAMVLFLGLYFDTTIITAFVAIIAGLGVYELVANAAKIEWFVFRILSCVYTVVMVFIFSDWLSNILQEIFKVRNAVGTLVVANGEKYYAVDLEGQDMYILALYAGIAAAVTIAYVIVCAVLILIKQSDFDLSKIAVLCGMPILYAFAFSTISSIVTLSNNIGERGGIYYLLLILNFACVCDMGAYFVGVSMGKRKLCPSISPNKTIEGAIGGIVSSMLVSLIIALCYGNFDGILLTLLFTIPLCAAGMVGDLFASIIKRKVGIKDYGNLIPGHGGVLDRVDSMLFISPLVYCLIVLGIL